MNSYPTNTVTSENEATSTIEIIPQNQIEPIVDGDNIISTLLIKFLNFLLYS